jgi:hypothetical protein
MLGKVVQFNLGYDRTSIELEDSYIVLKLYLNIT